MANSSIHEMDKRRFDALAGYTRQPPITLITREIHWFSSNDERVLGTVTFDFIDHDFGWVMLGRDKQKKFRAIGVNSSLPSEDAAKVALIAAMNDACTKPDDAFFQGDEAKAPVDFFTPIVPLERLHPVFKVLSSEERYSPARELIDAMMRYHNDADGNFIEQFQTTGFDARLWELYLFAAFNELAYARLSKLAIPDFMLVSGLGELAVEATTVNAPQQGAIPNPKTQDEFTSYLQDYVPIKIARSLRRKLERKPPYWEARELKDVPFALAVQDFHGPGSMRMIVPATTEYVFGVRHSIVDGRRHVEWITEHRYGRATEASGFFKLPGSENISAVIVNPQGTITKFNRLGYLANFGSRRVKMVRTGIRRAELDPDGPLPKAFRQNVCDPDYDESWIEGMVVLHNPHALIPLDPALLPGAAHEFLQEDGSIMSMLPDFQPFFSQTSTTVESKSSEDSAK